MPLPHRLPVAQSAWWHHQVLYPVDEGGRLIAGPADPIRYSEFTGRKFPAAARITFAQRPTRFEKPYEGKHATAARPIMNMLTRRGAVVNDYRRATSRYRPPPAFGEQVAQLGSADWG